ncbi:LysR substrate-binding domain-containing protein [Enterovibrio calviensis]|uniref:LysR substrate-binding domain-containing protein n=1 Tax=Enterovibrio calviensis TaxID=91359 RepID=UPI0005550D7A|nr:LysR substrate-binding domain-containing protein [Enterovibrio calviensis]
MNHQSLLRNLHTFSSAARTLSFTETATELHLTQGAVSHRIKVLEKELGFNLFVRRTRMLALTEEGEKFQATLSKSLNSIFSEIDNIRTTELSGELTIATSPGIANEWLIPRLSDFKAKYPKFNLNILTHDVELDFDVHAIDIAIYYGEHERVNMFSKKMFGEKYIPVCTPAYAKTHRLFEDGLASLQRVNFLYAKKSTAWKRWAKQHKVVLDTSKQFITLTHQDMAVYSARKGLGVAMGRYRFVKDALESGDLVAPYPAMETQRCHSVLCPQGTENRPKVRTFLQWIDSQLA